jgi:hypothetical protein
MELYKDIETMPITVFMKFQKYVLIENGVGTNVQDFSKRLAKLYEYTVNNKPKFAMEEIANLQTLFYNVVEKEQDAKLYALSYLVKGNEQKSEDEVKEFIEKNLKKLTTKYIYELYFELKKKLLAV